MSGFSTELVWRAAGEALLQAYQKDRKLSLTNFLRRLISDHLLTAIAGGQQSPAASTLGDLSQSVLLNFILETLRESFGQVGQAGELTTTFQFMKYPAAADWGNGCDTRAYQIANSTPQGIRGFYEHGHLLDASYRAFIQALRPVVVERHPRYRELDDLLEEAAAKELSVEAAARQAYMEGKACGGESISFAQWLNREEGLFWKRRIGRVRETISVYEREQDELRCLLNQALDEAKKKLNPPVLDTMYISVAGGKVSAVPKVTIMGNLAQDKAHWLRNSHQYACDIRVSSRDLSQKLFENVKNKMIREVLAMYMRELNPQYCYELRFRAVGIGCYNILRGNWFCPELIKPDALLIEGGTLTKETFFGTAGSLRLLPSSLLVLYRPTIEIRSSSAEDLKPFACSDVKGACDFTFLGFPMCLGSNQLPIPHQKDGIFSIQFFSPEDYSPQVIGITSLLTCGNA